VQTNDITWYTLPELSELFDLKVTQVHRLIEERSLLALRVDGVLKVPADFVRDGAPLPELRGTLTLLADAGFSDDEALRWLVEDEDSLGTRPIDALREGRKSEVRRVVQALGF